MEKMKIIKQLAKHNANRLGSILALAIGLVSQGILIFQPSPVFAASGGDLPGLSVIPAGSCYNALIVASFNRQKLMTVGSTQYITYYSPNTNVVVGSRTLGTTNWTLNETSFQPYDATDGHDDVDIGMGSDGYLHCSWGMHNNNLNYARSISPGSLTLVKTNMTGAENSVAYPQFINLPNGDVLFLFRQGGSGNGDAYLNRWSSATHSWTNVNYNGGQQPFIQGRIGSLSSPYFNYPMLDAQTNLVLTWCWRDNSVTSQSNHDQDYARSADFGKTWKTYEGASYTLPITPATGQIIWPIQTNYSLMNQCGMTIDTNNRPVIATYWAPEGEGTPIQYFLIWNNGASWQTNQIGQRTSTNSPGRPLIVCDKSNNLFMLFSDSAADSQPSLAWCTNANRAIWNSFPLMANYDSSWETTYDPIRWQRDNILDFIYYNGATLPYQMLVYEFNPAMFLTNIPTQNNLVWTNKSGNWSTSTNWAANAGPQTGGSNNLILTFAGNTNYTATNNFGGTFTLNQLMLNSAGNGTNIMVGNALALSNYFSLHLGIRQSGSAAFVISNAISAADDLGVFLGSAAPVFFRGNLSCAGGLTVSGPGQLVLSGVNTIPGTINLTDSTLIFGNSSLGAGGNLYAYSGTLRWLPGSTANIVSGRTTRFFGQVTLDPNGNTITLSGSTSGTGGIGQVGGLTLDAPNGGTIRMAQGNSYAGPTILNSGTFALSTGGSINGSTSISIGAGATFDVSALGAYTLGTNASLAASGTGITVGTTAATIRGAAGNTVNLGSQPLEFLYDGAHPALYISQGNLVVKSNSFTVNAATPLAPGTYPIVQQAAGSISATGSFTVDGTAVGSGRFGSIAVSGTNVNLIITVPTPVPQYFTYSPGTNLWSSTSNFWGNVSGGPYTNLWVDYNTATFEGTGGTVTISENSVNVFTNLNFTGSGYTLAATNGYLLNLRGSNVWLNASNTVQFPAPLVTDPGSLLNFNCPTGNTAVVLQGTNTIGGQININQGKVLCNYNYVLNGCTGVSVGSGGSLQVGNTGNFTINGIPASITGSGVNGGASALQGFSSSTCGWVGPVTLAGNSSIGSRQGVFTVSGAISDNGNGYGLVINNKTGTTYATGIVILSATNSYSGATTVATATLLVNGSIGSGAVIVSNTATLGGNGIITGPVTIQSGGTFAPGVGGMATLTLSNSLNLSAGSTNWMEIDGSTLASDQVVGLTNVTYGGSLIVTNIGGTSALTNGARVVLFSATTYNPSAFAFTNLPPLATNLVWDVSQLAINGSLQVKSITVPTPVISRVVLTGGSLVIQGTNGPPGSGYSILTATNLTQPSAQWLTNTTGNFNGLGWFSNGLPFNSTEPQRFYRVRTP